MVWLIQRDFTPYANVRFEVTPPCAQLSPPRSYYAEKGVAKPLAGISHANIDIEDHYWPTSARLETDREELPHLVAFCGFLGVSEELRDLIESYEFGVHEFRPVRVSYRDGRTFYRNYYAMNIRRRITDIVDFENSQIKSQNGPFGKVVVALSKEQSDRVVLRTGAVDGAHLFNTPDIVGGNMLVSDEMHEEIYRRKLNRGIMSVHLIEPDKVSSL